ncbi:MAG: phosphoenolpyruvate carboxylase [Rhodothermales bacterium]|jgi:phosphoenolpyruvate carboxylase
MRLDLRENSVGFRQLVRELLTVLGQDQAYESADDLTALWDLQTSFPGWSQLEAKLSERSYDLLAAIVLAHERWSADPNAVGPCIISMTHKTTDVLWVLWLYQCVQRWLQFGGGPSIAPLFETVDDLQRSADMLRKLFAHPLYRQHLTQAGSGQTVMIGYSDSAKDGGYVAACWALYKGQQEMEQAAAEAGVSLTCFHGRGGALGRGGGPAARAIEALLPTPGQARIRMTEQGEVIADRFVDADLAHRHMEQILAGLIRHAATATTACPEWQSFMNRFSAASRDAYLAIYQHEGFYQYFRQATPAAHIESLPIGSRPSRRSGAGSLEDLRAIPFTFSWTQSRQLLNAFYGLGAAWQACDETDRQLAQEMYLQWPFFRSMIDNAELALMKCDDRILMAYSQLMDDSDAAAEIAGAITMELAAAKEAVLEITDQESLLAKTPWLRQSVERRKPYLDVLNFMQIALVKR